MIDESAAAIRGDRLGTCVDCNVWFDFLGFGPNRCPECAAKQQAEWEKHAADRAAIDRVAEAARRLMAARIPSRFFSELPPLALPDWSESGVLLISGAVGSGKTHRACQILRDQIRGGARGLFCSAGRMILEIQRTYSGDENTAAVVDRYAAIGVLVLDDLGTERPTDDALFRLGLLVDERWANCRPTIATSNLSLGDIAKVYGERLASRLGSGERVELAGKDRRVGEA